MHLNRIGLDFAAEVTSYVDGERTTLSDEYGKMVFVQVEDKNFIGENGQK